jgi:hypothetical protein
MNYSGAARRMTAELPLGTDARSVRRRVEALERLLENTFRIPLIKQPIGLDAIGGLIPVAGDVITGLMGLYLIWEARNLGMSRWQLMRMSAHVGFDTLLGMIPLVGDLLDFFYRSNTRNLRIIQRHLDKHHPGSRVIGG